MPVKVKANPTFPFDITIATPEGDMKMTLEYKHMTSDAYDAFWEDALDKSKVYQASVEAAKAAGEPIPEAPNTALDDVMDIVVGWQDFDTPFSREAMGDFMQSYHLAAMPIFMGWREGLRVGKPKN